MDKKKTIILLWLFTACFALVMPSSLWAQSAVKNLQFCGSDTRNDSVVLFFRLLDDTGKRITSLDEENVKKHLNIFEDGAVVTPVELIESGILNKAAIDESDLTWLAWSRDETISLQEFLTYTI